MLKKSLSALPLLFVIACSGPKTESFKIVPPVEKNGFQNAEDRLSSQSCRFVKNADYKLDCMFTFDDELQKNVDKVQEFISACEANKKEWVQYPDFSAKLDTAKKFVADGQKKLAEIAEKKRILDQQKQIVAQADQSIQDSLKEHPIKGCEIYGRAMTCDTPTDYSDAANRVQRLNELYETYRNATSKVPFAARIGDSGRLGDSLLTSAVKASTDRFNVYQNQSQRLINEYKSLIEQISNKLDSQYMGVGTSNRLNEPAEYLAELSTLVREHRRLLQLLDDQKTFDQVRNRFGKIEINDGFIKPEINKKDFSDWNTNATLSSCLNFKSACETYSLSLKRGNVSAENILNILIQAPDRRKEPYVSIWNAKQKFIPRVDALRLNLVIDALTIQIDASDLYQAQLQTMKLEVLWPLIFTPEVRKAVYSLKDLNAIDIVLTKNVSSSYYFNHLVLAFGIDSPIAEIQKNIIATVKKSLDEQE